MKRVRWEIDVEAATAEQAAIRALSMMRNPDTIATVFDVTGKDGKTVRVDLAAKEIPAVCPACGADNVAQCDVIPSYTSLRSVRLDGQIEWSGDTDVQWSDQRPASNPPEYLCLSCGKTVSLAAIIAKATRKPTKRRKRPC